MAAATRILLSAALVILVHLMLYNNLTREFSRNTETQRRAVLSEVVLLARNTIEPIVGQVRDGALSRDEGLTQVRNLVRRMTYRDEYGPNYVFMSAYDGTMLVQPFEPHMELTDQWELCDDHGTLIIQELIRTARSPEGQGFVGYYYFPPESRVAEEKLAFVMGIPELDCYIGTGMYMQQAQKEQRALLNRARLWSLGLTLLLLLPIFFSLRELHLKNRDLIREVEDRKAAQTALALSEHEYRELVESANSIILRMDREGRITFFNSFAQRFFGYSEEEILGKTVFETIVPLKDSTGRDLSSLIRAIVETPDAYTINENENVRKDGQRVWVAWTNRLVMDDEGRPSEILSIGNDMTARRIAEQERARLEDQLLQAQKMESIGRLAGGVAHDFNNLLTAILGYAELTLEALPTDDTALRPGIMEIRKAGERARKLTQQLLAFGRKQVLEMRPLDLNHTLLNFEGLVRRVIGEHIHVRMELTPEATMIRGDTNQIEQVVLNLVVNARDAMPQGGTLTIATGRTAVEPLRHTGNTDIPPGCYVVLSVADTGHGIDEDSLPRLFEPFYTTKETGKGTGLGLATAYGIVRQHGGYFEVETQPASGSVFRVLFPEAGETNRANAAAPSPPSVPRVDAAKVLVVEDDDVVRRLACLLLKQAGHTVIETREPTDAARIAQDHGESIDLLLTDVVMPGMNGPEVYQSVRAVCPRIRVVYMSGYTDDALAPHGVLDPGTLLVPKPFTAEVLLAKVQSALERT